MNTSKQDTLNNKPIIVNLSSHNLTQEQIELLSLGLKFTPTPQSNQDSIKADTKEFTRKLRLGEFFLDEEKNTDESVVRNKSNFVPPRGRNRVLDTYIDNLIAASEIVEHSNQRPKYNMIYKQRKALHELQQLTNITIKEADKGGAIVIMDTDFYEQKIHTLLNNKDTYKRIPKNIDKETLMKINQLIHKYGDILTEKEKDYLTNFDFENSTFYGLPKIHKSEEIIRAVSSQEHNCVNVVNVLRPSDLQFRPIVAGPNCPTHRLSHLIDLLLKPFLQNTKSYVRDDLDFLTKLPPEIKDTEQFVTFDICNLYSNISQDLGVQAIKYWLNKHPEKHVPRFPAEFIIEGLEIILKNNSFEFGDKQFLQINGTAMGTKMAPTYANLTLAYLEEEFYTRLQNKYNEETSKRFEKSWKRYIDDCFIVWDTSIDDAEELHKELNTIHPQLKFTMEKSETEVAFLDISIKKEGKNVITDIYHKPTDTKQYLHFKSCHPRSTKENIPYNLARRICTIITQPVLRQRRLNELTANLRRRGYPNRLIQNGIDKAKSLSIETLRTPQDKPDVDVCTFVNTHNPNNLNMWNIIQNTMGILKTDARCRKMINSTTLINSRRQPPNLKKLLTKAKFDTSNPAVNKCSDNRCGTCPLLITGETFLFKGSTQPFRVKHSMNCGTENLLYVIQCQGCMENYIGQTSDTLRTRMRVHKQQINTPEYRKIAVSKHIAECARDKDIRFKVFPFYKIMKPEKTFRDVKEQRFINIYKPLLNNLSLI